MTGALVWVDAWQLQCCGQPFAVGDEVGWTVSDKPETEVLASYVGPRLARRIAYAEDHHGLVPDDAPLLRGVVRSIRVSNGDAVVPLVDASQVDGREPDPSDSRLNGYVVELVLGAR